MPTIFKRAPGASPKLSWGWALWAPLLALFLTCGCAEPVNRLHDGYFTAEAQNYDEEGWKNYLTIYVNNGQITIVEFDAANVSGFRRSWDMDYALEWNSRQGTRPGKYHLSYQNSLLTLQDPAKIQPLPGGRNMHLIFTKLATSAIERAQKGDKSVAFIQLPDKPYPDDI
ncbi:MAG: FMN-binding protein [Deltaproteobacteria bacterium]|jgi:major membrane immunogen (membrane-anchored lipoprotein)|nr:FMN-binding protein [Deltaproteobacteria bacterium]